MDEDPSSDGSDRPILIVGAGPTGLILAIELARRKVPFHLIDRMAGPAPWSACIFIKPRSLEILAALGLIEDFLEQGQVIDSVDVYLEDTVAGFVRFGDLDTPYPFILSVPEVQTVELLTGKLEALGGKVEWGIELLGLEEQDGHVDAQLKSEKDGVFELRSQWVVGADGYHSAVRNAIGDAFDGRDYTELWGVADSRIENWRHPRNVTCVQFQPPIVLPFPLGDDRWRIYFRPETADESAFETVNERLAVISTGARLVDPDTPAFFKSHSRLARSFRIGRVLLAGDAAHGSNPIEGHGMNAGMQDAFNLGWKLAIAASSGGSDHLLASYEAERRPVDQSIVSSGDDAYARMDPKNEEARRNLAKFLATPEGRIEAAVADTEIGYTYSEGPLVEESADRPALSSHHTEIGARLGDVTGLASAQGATSLHALVYGRSPTIFILPETGSQTGLAEARSLVDEVAAPWDKFEVQTFIVLRGEPPSKAVAEDILFDPTGLLHERTGGGEPCLCLVRPDGHLGFRSAPPDPDSLRNYLERLYGTG